MATILIIDDRPTNRELLVTLLGAAGYRLLEAVDGQQGLVVARAECPDLIITDIVMPKMDGYEFARQVRTDPSIRKTQIIFYTSSYILEETRRLAEACGVSIVIGKPIEPELFLETIRAALETKEIQTVQPVAEEFYREHMRLLTHTLVRKVEDLEAEITERKRAEEKIRQQLQYLTTLSEIDRAISSSFDLQFSLDTVLLHVIAQLGVDAADILLFDTSLLKLEYIAGQGFHNRSIETSPISLSRGYAARTVLNRQPLYVSNLGKQPDDDAPRAALFAKEGFVSYYVVPLQAKGELNGLLEIFHRSRLEPDKEWLDFLNTLAGQCAIAIDNATLFSGLQRSNTELVIAYDATIEGWSRALDLRDKETEGHSQRVTEMSIRLARRMGMNDEELLQVRRGALLHDIGKMGVPDRILLKPGSLAEDEWVIMKKHPDFAHQMLSSIAYLVPALDIPYCHHEKWDGTGYPRGLKGKQIPLAARVFAIVDVCDALLSDRPYRAAWPVEKVREHIQFSSGTHFDPEVVAVFLKSDILRPQ